MSLDRREGSLWHGAELVAGGGRVLGGADRIAPSPEEHKGTLPRQAVTASQHCPGWQRWSPPRRRAWNTDWAHNDKYCLGQVEQGVLMSPNPTDKDRTQQDSSGTFLPSLPGPVASVSVCWGVLVWAGVFWGVLLCRRVVRGSGRAGSGSPSPVLRV